MTGTARPRARRHPAHALCGCFEGSQLAAFARPGLAVLETEHKACVTGGNAIACGVALDRARKDDDSQSARWDYLFTLRAPAAKGARASASVDAVAVEVHHADVDEVPKMIAKKTAAEALLARECPTVNVGAWLWVASPPRGEIFFLRQSPAARQLAEAGIEFPRTQLTLP